MARQFQFLTADVFTDHLFGGNQLAVFPNAAGIPEQTMQQIAREMNLSETVFVFPPETAAGTRRLRIYTPANELPFAGHPTVGAAFVLASMGEIALTGDETSTVFEEGVGPVPVVIRSRGGRPVFCQLTAAKLPQEGPPPPPRAALAEVLSLGDDQIGEGDERPRAFSCGVPFLFVTLRDLDALASIRINNAAWERHIAGYWATDIYTLTRRAADGEIRSRMFAPGLGIAEDPATGGAAAALAGYLARPDLPDGVSHWTVRQGVEMGRPSTIEVEADMLHGAITEVRVGGSSVMVSEGVMTLPA
ncbi:MAG: PhzF family phenazine biosynthesis protein [Chthoniobacterales bacterium]|nr:PhzF family phenazine biosynthesis protein [Chthoniobacterales bacterium]